MHVNGVAQRSHDTKTILLSLVDGDAMTQEEIAHDIGVSVRTVSRWWNGWSIPSKKHLDALRQLAAK